MQKKASSIPVNYFGTEGSIGIIIDRLSLKEQPVQEEATQAHRHDVHSFFLLEKGTILIEIDFISYKIKSPAIVFMHPNQVHQIKALKNVTVSTCAISIESLKPEYLKLLDEITPASPLALNKETFSLISDVMSLCINLYGRKEDKLYSSLLKDGCNTLAGLVISLYLEKTKPQHRLSRFEITTKAFNELLESGYRTMKRPAAYADKLNISAHYLNECVKNTTGHSVSHHIQQRIILEARRLLYHSNKSVKEISVELGFDDYAYFSRLFTKSTGMTALAFRAKNHV